MAQVVANARRKRTRYHNVLRDRITTLTEMVGACDGIHAQADKTIVAGARAIANQTVDSLEKYAEAVSALEDVFADEDLIVPVQRQEQLDDDAEHADQIVTHQHEIDQLLILLARYEEYVRNFERGQHGAAAAIANANNNNADAGARPRARPTVKQPPLLEHDVDLSTFNAWRQSFNDWATATQVVDEPRDVYISHLRSLMSLKMKATLEHSIGIDANTQLDVPGILDALYQHIRATRSVAVDLVEFERRVQGRNEKFDDFFVSLKKLSQNAAIPHCCRNNRLLNRLMAGCYDSEVRQELMRKYDRIELPQAVEICRSKESSKQCASAVVGSDPKVQAVKVTPKSKYRGKNTSAQKSPPHKTVTPKPPQQSQQRTPQSATPSKNNNTGCPSCGFLKHTNSEGTCPAKNANCAKCNKTGHFASVCRSKQASSGKFQRAISVRHASRHRSSPLIKVDIFHKGRLKGTTSAMPDSGAEVTMAGPDFLSEIGWEGGELNLNKPSEKIFAANNTQFLLLGSVNLEIVYRNRSAFVEVFIVNEPSHLLISWKACIDLAILPECYPLPVPVDSSQVRQVSTHLPRRTLPSDKVDLSSLGDIPDEPSEADIARIHKKLLSLYKDVFCEKELAPMSCEPFEIELLPGAVPLKTFTSRAIPLAMMAMVKAELDEMLAMGIIAPVRQSTDWCHPICCVPKPCGGLRFCVDLRALNKWVKRPVHPLVTPVQAIQSIPPNAKWFSSCDAKKGYWQVALSRKSQLLTTFLTPWGRYCFLRAPMGLNATGDYYCREGDLALAGISDVTKVVDDILVATETFKDNVTRTVQVLDRCRQNKITLHPRKFAFGKKSLGFVGMLLSEEGIRSDPEKIRAIAEFPTPTNLTQLRSFLGMVGALPTVSSQITTLIGPLRDLRKTKNHFLWTQDHSDAFEALKSHICNSDEVLALFDPNRPTRLETDASRLHGLGFVLRQLHDNNQWRIVQCGSRFLTDAESRYSVIELECLALVWATRKLHVYLFGLQNYECLTDHAPLVPILNRYTLSAIENPRLQRLVEKLQSYNFTCYHVKGKDNFISDALSRAPIRDALPGEEEGEEMSEDKKFVRQVLTRSMVQAMNADQPSSIDSNLDWVREQTANDLASTLIRELIRKGFPRTIREVHPLVRPFWGVRSQLSESDGLIVRDGRQVVIPQDIRKEVLKRLHASHQGVEATRRRARQAVFWPAINSDIASTVGACADCQLYLPSQAKEPIRSDEIPSSPFVDVSTDLFSESGQVFMVMVCLYTGWPMVHRWYQDPTSRQVINVLKSWFCLMGIPTRLKSDNGPQYSADDFKQFCREWNIKHVTSSPHYPQSNAHSELCVKLIKRLVQKVGTDIFSDSFARGLLEIRNTPRANGHSPAELLYNRPMRSHVPTLPQPSGPQASQVKQHRERIRQKTQEVYDRSAKPLPELRPGQQVLVQDEKTKRWSHRGTIIARGDNRDYTVDLGRSRHLVRNRRFIRPCPPETSP